MTQPLSKEARAEMRERHLNPPGATMRYSHDECMLCQVLDSHALVDEARDLATAKLATARLCDCVEVVHVYQPGIRERIMKFASACPHCVNGVVYSDERARELLEQLKRAEEDSTRLQWYLSDKPKPDFIDAYMQGIRENWDIDRWRREIDSARTKEG